MKVTPCDRLNCYAVLLMSRADIREDSVMGNFVKFGDEFIKMSNGLTGVFIDVLTLAGSQLAQTDDEKHLIVWLAEKDQNIIGMGTVSFDIRELPWKAEYFDNNKQFMLKVIEAAKNRTDWNKLGYQPNEEQIFEVLDKFANLISFIKIEDINQSTVQEGSDDYVSYFPKCPKHGVLLTCFGCIICNAYTEEFFIDKTPVRLYGEHSDRVYLYVHGKNGFKEEAAAFADIANSKGYQVLSVGLPYNGDCKPWEVVPILREVLNYTKTRWSDILLYAVSIGAWFSMLAYGGEELKKCLFVSPVLDMRTLIENMMNWAGVTEDELERQKIIPTDFGETLDHKYYQFVKRDPITVWSVPTEILCAENDNLTSRETVERFCEIFNCGLNVYKGGEHWFHTKEQLEYLRKWESINL